MAAVLIRNAEVWGRGLMDVRISGRLIGAVGRLAEDANEPVHDAAGGLLIPGLHDHHIHLAALAAERASIGCGPPTVTDAAELAAVLAQPGDGWIRGIGYHESIMGLPTARELDELVCERPLRLQHRSGRMWLLNSMAIAILLQKAPPPVGLEISGGSYTGRLFDEDEWLHTALAAEPPAFGEIGSELARYGVTGLTDMSPRNDPRMAAHFAAEMASGKLPQQVVLAGSLRLANASGGAWRLGPAKLHLHESALPEFDDAVAFMRKAHGQDRAVAVHCVSEVELVFALAAFDAAGPRRGDRIEHASIASDELVERIAELGLRVCVQPHFIAERGDDYLRDVDPRHRDELYRLRAFIAAGVPLSAGSDAPFGRPDPWAAMAAAVSRQTRSGRTVAAQEALSPEEALRLYLMDPDDLTRERQIEPGTTADLCLLDCAWNSARSSLSADRVAATWISGRLVQDFVD